MPNRVIRCRPRSLIVGLLALFALSFATAAVRPLASAQNRPFGRNRFLVEIAGITVDPKVFGFIEVSGLESRFELVEYREGKDAVVHKLPGQLHNQNLILRRGWTATHNLWEWYKNITDGIVDRRSGTITLLDADFKTVVSQWNFYEGFPVRYRIGGFDSHDSSPLIEEIEITFEKFELVQQ